MGKTAAPSAQLLSMPWTDVDTPNLGLGVLKAELQNHGIACRVRHLNIELLRFLKASTYYAISTKYALNDFLFSKVLDLQVTPSQLRYLRRRTSRLFIHDQQKLIKLGGEDGVIGEMLKLRDQTIPSWLEEKADEIAQSEAQLVGASCMFDQTISSVALLKLVAERNPDKLLVLGGYAVRQPTADAIMKAFPWIDAVCVEEGENVIVPLAEAAAGQRALKDVPGVVIRIGANVAPTTAPCTKRDLDEVPTPDFDDFIADIQDLSETHAVDITMGPIPIENSRGCWWGQKNHCIFCGIRDQDLIYRYRSPERALSDLSSLAKKYDQTSFRFTDYIMPNAYYKTLMVDLVGAPEPFTLDGEIKANVGSKEMQAMAEAGFRSVQPGIESFSSTCLRKMNKGVNSVQNVYLLRLGQEFGITIRYNLLYGFPDDQELDYLHMAREMKWMSHFDLPMSYVPVQITRYSPMHMAKAMSDPGALHPAGHYNLVFSRGFLEQSGFELDKYCYLFERPFANAPRLHRQYRAIGDTLQRFRRAQAQEKLSLAFRPKGDGLRVLDQRLDRKLTFDLDAAETCLYREFDTPNSKVKAFAAYNALFGSDDAEEVYLRLRKKGLVFEDEGLAVGLMVSAEALEARAEAETIVQPEKALPAAGIEGESNASARPA